VRSAKAHTTILYGKVCSGQGRAAEVLRSDFQEINRHFDAPVMPGTLNILLGFPAGLDPDECVITRKGRLFWSATLADHSVLIYRWDDCPLHVIEVLSPVALRERLRLCDDDTVGVEVGAVRKLSFLADCLLVLCMGI
jgi:CTP-dependent riboflavin kinase